MNDYIIGKKIDRYVWNDLVDLAWNNVNGSVRNTVRFSIEDVINDIIKQSISNSLGVELEQKSHLPLDIFQS